MEMKLLDSGFGEYKDKFEYIFVKTFTKIYESDTKVNRLLKKKFFGL